MDMNLERVVLWKWLSVKNKNKKSTSLYDIYSFYTAAPMNVLIKLLVCVIKLKDGFDHPVAFVNYHLYICSSFLMKQVKTPQCQYISIPIQVYYLWKSE